MDDSIDNFIRDLLSALKKQQASVSRLYRVTQTKDQKLTNMVTVNGKPVPFKEVEAKLFIDGYQNIFLISALDLLQTVYSQENSPMVVFGLRTCIDLCMYRSRIIFDHEKLIDEKGKLFTLCLMLDDYASMATKNTKYKDYYLQILEEEKITHIKLKPIFDKLTLAVKDNNLKKIEKSLIDLRQEVNSLQALLLQSIPLPVEFTKSKLTSIKSSFSHILHGHAFLITNLLSPEAESVSRRIFFARFTILISGITLLNIIEGYLNKQGDHIANIDNFNSRFYEVYDKLGKSYQFKDSDI